MSAQFGFDQAFMKNFPCFFSLYFDQTKAKKKKWHNEISSQVEGAGLKTSEEMPLISDTSEPLAPLAVSDKSTPDGPETENDALTSLPLPVTPVLPPQEKLQLKRVIEPIRSAARGRPAKRARGRPMVRSRDGPAAQATAVTAHDATRKSVPNHHRLTNHAYCLPPLPPRTLRLMRITSMSERVLNACSTERRSFMGM